MESSYLRAGQTPSPTSEDLVTSQVSPAAETPLCVQFWKIERQIDRPLLHPSYVLYACLTFVRFSSLRWELLLFKYKTGYK